MTDDEKARPLVLITGASSGIGRATAEVFAERGFDLALAARRLELLEESKRELEAKHRVSVTLFPGDLSGIDGARRLHESVTRAGLRVDVLVNNAGFGTSGPFVDIDLERETEMIELNVIALTALAKLFGKELAERRSGHIVNIASTASFQPVPGFAAYAATKAYVVSLSEALAFELRASGVKVTAVCPGATKSEFAKTAGMEGAGMFDRAPTSRELGEFVYRAVASGKAVAIHGLRNAVMARLGAFAPRRLVMAVAARLVG